MPGTDGIEATRQLAADGDGGPRVLVLTTFDLDEYVYDALAAGASGFLLKDVTAERLFEAVRLVAAGEALLAPAGLNEIACRRGAARAPSHSMEQPAEVLSHGKARLRRWRAGDVDELYRVVSDCLDHLRPWMPWASGYDRASAAEFLAACEHDWDGGLAYNYAVLSDGAVAGSCGLISRIGPGGLDIGYWLHPAYTGRGLATDAAAALVEQAFTLPGVDFVTIRHDLANTASGAIPRRLGFDQVGRRDRAQPEAPGEAGVLVVWRLTRDQAARRGLVHAG